MGRVYRFRVKEVSYREVEIRGEDSYADARALIESGNWDDEENATVHDMFDYHFTVKSLGSKADD